MSEIIENPSPPRSPLVLLIAAAYQEEMASACEILTNFGINASVMTEFSDGADQLMHLHPEIIVYPDIFLLYFNHKPRRIPPPAKTDPASPPAPTIRMREGSTIHINGTEYGSLRQAVLKLVRQGKTQVIRIARHDEFGQPLAVWEGENTIPAVNFLAPPPRPWDIFLAVNQLLHRQISPKPPNLTSQG